MRTLQKPNILFLIVDEWRYPVSYETPELKQWKLDNLQFYNTISSKGTVFHKHYTNTNACVPARTTIQTGMYPSIHGNNQTDGVAKSHFSGLPAYTVPTMGNYLNSNGYKCYLRGKWHVTDETIKGLSGNPISTFDVNGHRILSKEKLYLEKNVLKPYGYNGWIGPEPHGAIGLNMASSVPQPKIGRDEKITQQTLEILDDLKREILPWYLCVNLVDPHDIALYGLFAMAAVKNFQFEIDPTLPEVMFTEDFNASLNESLDTKPPTQKEYRDLYGTAFQPTLPSDKHIRYYYTLMKRADEKLMRIWNKVTSMPDYQNTIIVFTSDHGELLASHGGMHQKWYQAYDEALRVPLIISSPLYGNEHRDIYELTSHIDLLPTFLDMTGGNKSRLQSRLKKKNFSLVLDFPGKSILPLIKKGKYKKRPIYFYTEDHITQGDKQYNAMGTTYDEVPEPSCVEAIITEINGDVWKYTSYYSLNPIFRTGLGEIKHEIYNLTSDPLELNNLHANVDSEIKQKLVQLLDAYSTEHRLVRNLQ